MTTSRARSATARALALLVGAALGLAAGDGLVRGLTDRSLGALEPRRARPIAPSGLRSTQPADANTLPGAFAVDEDPAAGYRLQRDRRGDFAGGRYTTDERGHRVRIGPPKGPGSPTIAVVGDSVAFGFGVADHETLAHRLEDELARGRPGARRATAHTIACPTWNHVSSIRAVSRELPTLRPDLVVFVPVANDLEDGATVLESGDLARRVDPVRGAREPHWAQEHALALVASLLQERDPLRERGRILGVDYALNQGVTPRSAARFAAMAEDLLALRARLRAMGGELLVCALWDEPFVRRLLVDLWQREPDCPFVALFPRHEPEHSLPHDAHPNAAFLREAGRRLADHVLRTEWLGGGSAPAARAVEAAYAPLPEAWTRAALERDVAAQRERARERMADRIDLGDGTGVGQIYGGVFHRGSVTHGFDAVLHGGGAPARHVVVALRTLDLAGLYPLHVALTVNGRPAGEHVVEEHDPRETELAFPVPDGEHGARFLELALRTDHWVHDPSVGYLRAFELVRVGFDGGVEENAAHPAEENLRTGGPARR